MRLTTLRFPVLAAALLALPMLLTAQTMAGEKTAEQVFKNIQVFKGKPANELRPTMSFIASSLGVRCNFCHAQPFSADTKRPKATARMMIKMVYAINAQNFKGRPAINCYTCHQGHNAPSSMLSIAADVPAGAMGAGMMGGGMAGGPGGRGRGGPEGRGGPSGPGQGRGRGARPPMPPAQQILDKYVAAIGGASALAAIHSETVTGERTMMGRSMAEKVVRADGKMLVADGAMKAGYDGSQFWAAGPRGVQTDLGTDVIGQLQTDLDLYPGAGLRATGARVFAKVPLGDATAYLMAVRTPTGFARYYFDADSGLLLRTITMTPTFLGGLPLQVDYSDYRTVEGGAKLPFDIQWSTHERTWERKVSAIAINGTLDAAGFSVPAGGK